MKTKKEHYVPQAYLKAFARGGQLNVFDKTTGATFTSNIRDAASPRFFYDIPELDEATGVSQTLEKFFQPCEDEAACVLDALRSSLGSGEFVTVTEAQRIDLSLFLALQMIRTPEAREHFVQLSLTLTKKAFLAWVHEQRPGFQVEPGLLRVRACDDRRSAVEDPRTPPPGPRISRSHCGDHLPACLGCPRESVPRAVHLFRSSSL